MSPAGSKHEGLGKRLGKRVLRGFMKKILGLITIILISSFSYAKEPSRYLEVHYDGVVSIWHESKVFSVLAEKDVGFWNVLNQSDYFQKHHLDIIPDLQLKIIGTVERAQGSLIAHCKVELNENGAVKEFYPDVKKITRHDQVICNGEQILDFLTLTLKSPCQ